MTINTEILQYAANKKQFARKDLFAYFRKQKPALFPLSVSQQLNRFLQKKVKRSSMIHPDNRSREWLQQVAGENNFPNIPLIEKSFALFPVRKSLSSLMDNE